MLKPLMLTLIAIVLAAVPVSAMKGNMPPGKWWTHPELAAKLKLSEAEKTGLEKQYLQSRRNLIKLKSEVELERFELEVLLDSPTLSEAQALDQFKRLEKARIKLGEEMFRFVLAVRQIVGPDRFQILKQAHQKYRGKRGRRQHWPSGQFDPGNQPKPN
jgi:Spy/CpxP family protein refolding chaperone